MSRGNHKSKKEEGEYSSPEDWITASSPKDKRAACGKATQIVMYDDFTVSIMTFWCHRWDCPDCAATRMDEIKNQVLDMCSSWFATFIDNAQYLATTKKIERAHAKYCAVGTSEAWFILTDEQVLSPSRVLPQRFLPQIINLMLSGPYAYRRRRFRHSEGLFNSGKPKSYRHISQKITVAEGIKEVLAELKNQRYEPSSQTRDEYYLHVKGDQHQKSVEVLIISGKFNVLWGK